MFTTLRKFILPGVIIACTLFMALIFLEWGLDFSSRGQYGGNPNIAGVINGEEISLQYYNQIFSQMYQTEAQNSDLEISDERVRQLEDAAWQQVIQDRLLTQEANRNNITVSDQDVFSYLRLAPPQFIQNSPSFQTDGQFDYQIYLNTMADPQAAPFWAQFEDVIRSDVQKLKLQQLVTQMAHVTEAEAKQSYIDSVETISVKMVNIPFSRFASSPPLTNDEEQRKFYEERKEEYFLDERVVLNYVSLEIKPTENDWTEAADESKRLHELILSGSDFAELAGLYSDDPGSAANGGDLDWIAQGRMVPEFDSLSFSMNDGEISEPFKTDFGWHIIKHQGYRFDNEIPSGKTEKEDVRKAHVSHILVKVDASPDTRDGLNLKLDDFVTQVESGGFQAAAEAAGMEPRTTVPFQQNTFVRELSGLPGAISFAASSEVNDLSLVLEHNKSYYVLQLAEIVPAGLATYEEVQSRVRQDYVRYHIEQSCQDTLSAILVAIQSGTKIGDAATQFGAAVETISEVTRGGLGGRLRSDPRAIGAAFSLTTPGDLSPPAKYAGGSVLFSLVAREQPDLTSYNEKRDSVLQFVTQVKQQELFQDWYQNLLENADIQNYVSDL